MHFEDLPKLDEGEYLNDALIDFYTMYVYLHCLVYLLTRPSYLFKQLNVPSDKVYFFNTHFYTKLTEKTGRNIINYDAVSRWTSKVDIYSYDYIVVPINEK